MSTDYEADSPEPTKEVANYDEELAKMAKAATKVETAETSQITCKAGILMYNKEPVKGNALDVIIIASTHANLYYEKEYDPNNPTNPVCYAYSEDPDTKPLQPHPKCQKPQSDFCETCWANKWRSDPKGGKGKACKNSRRLGMIPAGVEVDDIPTAEIATMNLPVTSVAPWGTYVNKLSTLYRRPPLGVITTIGAEPDVKTQFKITYKTGPLISNEYLPNLFAKAKEAMGLLEKAYEWNPEETEEQAAEAAERQQRRDERGKKF